MDENPARRLVFARRRAALAAAVLLVVGALVLVLAPGGWQPARPAPPTARPPARPDLPPPVVPSASSREAAAVERVRRRLGFVVGGAGRRREVALTFDDGPGPYTPAVLDVLRREHAPATFFVVTSMLRYFQPALVREVHEGFAIGDHTVTHPLMSRLSRTDQLVQVAGAAAALGDAGAPAPLLFRPPYGGFNRVTLRILARQRLLGILWTVDGADYTRPGAPAIVRRVLSAVRPGGIVALHDAGGDRSQTVAALPALIRRLRRRGYELVTVPRLMLDDPPSRRQPLPPGIPDPSGPPGKGVPRGP